MSFTYDVCKQVDYRVLTEIDKPPRFFFGPYACLLELEYILLYNFFISEDILC